MKRFFLYIITCVCALALATNSASAQTPDGTEVTISYTTGETTYYLAVVNNAVTTVPTFSEDNCLWIQTANNAFWSVAANQYLTISTSNQYSLSLQNNERNLTNDNGKLYFRDGRRYYYISFTNNAFKGNRSGNDAQLSSLQIVTCDITPYATGHKYTTVTPAVGVTNAFNTITITTDVDMENELRFGPYNQTNNERIKFTHTNTQGTVTNNSEILEGLAIKKDNSKQFTITIPNDLGDGTYKLEIAEGAINGADGEPFQKKTYTWTVNPHTFASIAPETLEQGKHLETITVTATNNVAMSIADASKIVLKNAGNVTIPTTATVDVNNQLVITPVAALGNGTYTLTIADGAVLGPNRVNFVGTSKTWSVIVSVSITHVNGFYNALGAGGYQNVHTVERTIYYTGTENSIPLELAETNFFGYMRWYNYATDGGEDITWATVPSGNGGNFIDVQGSAKHLGWFGWNRSNQTGNPVANGGTGGVLNNTENSNKTPNINVSGWTGNHTIACDASHYLDYIVTRVDNKVVGVTEPRLSYRQLFHFKPASEMADKFAALGADEYLEEYTYTAPINTEVYLSTEFRYNGTAAENCYFYYDGTSIKRVTSATWSTGVTWSAPYGVVSSETEGTQTYTLTANNGALRIAKFTVIYVD